MARVIETKYDDPIEQDVILEQDKGQMDYRDILANAENILKSFLYLKEMYSSAPKLNKIVSIKYVEDTGQNDVQIPDEANIATIKNTKKGITEVYLNDFDKLVLLEYEQIDLPLDDSSRIRVNGKANVIFIKYEIR